MIHSSGGNLAIGEYALVFLEGVCNRKIQVQIVRLLMPEPHPLRFLGFFFGATVLDGRLKTPASRIQVLLGDS